MARSRHRRLVRPLWSLKACLVTSPPVGCGHSLMTKRRRSRSPWKRPADKGVVGHVSPNTSLLSTEAEHALREEVAWVVMRGERRDEAAKEAECTKREVQSHQVGEPFSLVPGMFPKTDAGLWTLRHCGSNSSSESTRPQGHVLGSGREQHHPCRLVTCLAVETHRADDTFACDGEERGHDEAVGCLSAPQLGAHERRLERARSDSWSQPASPPTGSARELLRDSGHPTLAPGSSSPACVS